MSTNRHVVTVEHCEAEHSVIQRTAHRFTGRFTVAVEAGTARSIVQLTGSIDCPEILEREFRAALLDDALRARVDADTAPLRRLIIEAALRSALREQGTGK